MKRWGAAPLVATAMFMSACGAGETLAEVDVLEPGETASDVSPNPATSDQGGQLGTLSAPGVVSGCAGTYTGQYNGDETGTVALSIGEEGQVITSAYPGLDVSYGSDGFINVTNDDGSVQIGPAGITIDGEQVIQVGPGGVSVAGENGEDIQVDADGGIVVDDGEGNTIVVNPDESGDVSIESEDGGSIERDADGGISIEGDDGETITVNPDGSVDLDPDGLTMLQNEGIVVGPGGISVGDGGGVVVTNGASTVSDDGLISIVTDDGRVLTGTFDWTTCTGVGSWTESGRNGTWLVAQDTTQIQLGDGSCDGAVYVGNDGVFVGPGGVAVTDQGISVGNGSVQVTPSGVSIGSGEVEFNALCTSEVVGSGESVAFDEVGDDVQVEQGDGYTSYAMNGDLLFAFNSSDLNPQATATIESIIASTSDRFPGAAIRILGHTDSVGTEDYNLELSQARSQAVAVVVGNDQRLAGTPIETYGLGESSPVAPNANADGSDSPDGRALNRRVEVVVLTG